ncbi:hypothetical protein D3C76_360390 [compost metagenome]
MQFFADRCRHFLTYSPTIFIAHVPRLAFDLVQTFDRVQRLFGQLAFVRHVQIEKLAPGVGHASDFSDALLKTGFVACEVIANQLATPVAQEVARMFACTAWAEIINHGFERRIRRRAVGPNIGSVGFLLARRKHLHRCFISVNHALVQHGFTQCIDQRLKPHTGLSDPLGQGRASNRQPGAAKDFLLPVQRQVIGKLGHHYVGQQA